MEYNLFAKVLMTPYSSKSYCRVSQFILVYLNTTCENATSPLVIENNKWIHLLIWYESLKQWYISKMENIDLVNDSALFDTESDAYESSSMWLVFVLIYGLIFILGSSLNTVLLVVFIRRPSFRIHLSNR